ncbi:hypothetical protein FNJ62_20295 [Streptomyces benahoarensis]|nr:hypothetical protein FNJ62_20295 [Streptomyces benahoarensis]
MVQLRPRERRVERASVVQGKMPTNRWEMQVQGLPGALKKKVPSSYEEGTFFVVCLDGKVWEAALRCENSRGGPCGSAAWFGHGFLFPVVREGFRRSPGPSSAVGRALCCER